MRAVTLRTVANSHIKSERKKFILTSLSIGAAAFFIAVVFLLSQTMNASFRSAVGTIYERADYVVNAPANRAVGQSNSEASSTLSAEQWQAIQDSDAVDSSWGRTNEFLSYTAEKDGVSGYLKMEAVPTPTSIFTYDIDGTFPTQDDQVLISSIDAQNKGLHIGDRVELGSPLDRSVTVSGIFTVDSPFSPDVSTMLFTQAVVNEVSASDGDTSTTPYTEAIITLKDPSAGFPEGLRQTLESGNDNSAAVIVTGDEQTNSFIKSLMGEVDLITYVLLAFAGIALVVSSFVIANTFRVLTTLRVLELAMLRTLGARRRQLTRMLLLEALVLGFVSSMIGVVLAYLLALVLHTMVPAFIVIGFSPVAGLIGILVGTLVTVLASLIPALSAMKVSPLAAISRAQTVEADSAVSRKTLVCGSLLILAGSAMFTIARVQDQAVLVMLATFIVAIGILLVFPLILWLILRVLQRLAQGSGLLTLAINQTVHAMRRTGSTGLIVFLSTLLISAVLTGYSTGMASNSKLAETTYPIALQAPVFEQDTSEGKAVSLQDVEAKQDELLSIEHVSGANIAVPAGFISEGLTKHTSDGTPAVYAVEASTVEQTLPRLSEDFAENTVVLPSYYDASLDGQKLIVSAGDQKLEVTARISDLNLYMPLMSYSTAESLVETGAAQENGYAALINTDQNLTSVQGQKVINDVAQVTGASSDSIFGGLNDRLRNEQIMKVFVYIILGLLSVATLIALIGIANTLSLSAHQRRRENTMLRSIGLSAQKLTQIVALESVLVATVAVLCGTVAGIGLAIMAVQTLAVDGIEMVYSVPPFALLVLIVFGIGLAYLASLLPAKRASRVSPVEALRIS